jgi:adenosylcobinamide kinase/adenosylcobinamide-phosphate guanylyltransferase
MARRFRDEQGLANQALAAIADNVYFIAAGLPLKLKG